MLWAVCGLVLVACTSRAHAAEVLLLEPKMDGPVLSSEVDTLQNAARKALQAQQFGLVDARESQSVLAGEAQLRDCYTDLCLERLGRLLAATLVVRYRGKVSQPPGKDQQPVWKFSVDVLDVEIGATGAHVIEECTSCTIKEAAAKLGDMVARAVMETASRSRGSLDVRSEPMGATVYVDGTELGVTPYKRPLFVGKHKLTVRHVGYLSQQLEIEVADGQKVRQEIKMVAGTDPVSVVVVEKERTPLYKKWWFWTAIGGAVAVAGAVTAAIVLSNRPSPPPDRMVPMNVLMF